MVTMGAETLPSGFRSTVGEKGSVIRVTFLPRNWKQEWPSQEISMCSSIRFTHKFGREQMSPPDFYCTIRIGVLQGYSQEDFLRSSSSFCPPFDRPQPGQPD